MRRLSEEEWKSVFDCLDEMVVKFNNGRYGNDGSRVDEIVLPRCLFSAIVAQMDTSQKLQKTVFLVDQVYESEREYIRHGGILWRLPTIELTPGNGSLMFTILNDRRSGTGTRGAVEISSGNQNFDAILLRLLCDASGLLDNER